MTFVLQYFSEHLACLEKNLIVYQALTLYDIRTTIFSRALGVP